MLCLSGIIVLAAVLIFKLQIIALFKLSPENVKMAAWLLPYIGILSIYIFIANVFNATLSGLGRMDWANYIQTAGKVIAIVVAAVLFYLGRGIESMIISSAIAYLFIQVVSIICVRKMIPIRILHISNLNVQFGQRLLSFGGTVFSGSLISMLLSPFNKLMLSRYAGVSTVPIYEIAYTGSMQIRALFEVSLRALMPEISRIGIDVTMQTKNRISRIYSYSMKLILLLGIPVLAALAIFAPILLKVWLRDRFVETLPSAFRIMLAGAFLSLLCVPAYYTLMGLGRVHLCFLSQVIQGIVNAATVGVIIILTGWLSTSTITLSVVFAMGAASSYLLWQNQNVMRRFHVDVK